jgi:hypothetical protein
MDLELAWDGPYSWFGDGAPALFPSAAASSSGIYVWTASMPEGEWAYYVGQTTKSFGDRHWDHWREYASGAYSIHEADAFYRGGHRLLYQGFNYRRPAHKYLEPFIRSIDEHLAAAVRLLRPMRIWLGELPPDRRLQRRVEGAVIRALYAQDGPAKSFQEPSMRAEVRTKYESPVRVKVRTPCPFVGLPSDFEA